MKNIIKIVLLLSFGFGFVSAKDEVSPIRIYKFRKKLITIESKRNQILLGQEEGSRILTNYLIKVKKHLAFVTSFMAKKGKCLELESSHKSNNNEVVKCYKKLETSLYEFEDKQKEFLKLKKSIQALKEMLNTDKNSLPSLEKQKETIEGLIRQETSRLTDNNELDRRNVEKLIEELSK